MRCNLVVKYCTAYAIYGRDVDRYAYVVSRSAKSTKNWTKVRGESLDNPQVFQLFAVDVSNGVTKMLRFALDVLRATQARIAS